MQPIQFFAARAEDGALLPNATVDVFLAGTKIPAALFAANTDAAPINNPTHADMSARVFFYTSADRVDIRISRGGYVAPLIEDFLVTDPADILAAAQLQVELAAAKVSEASVQAYRSEQASNAALLSKNVWPTTAAGIGQGVAGTVLTAAGSGGTDATYDLGFIGGTQVIAPKGRFVVSGNVVTQIIIDYPGYYTAGIPSLSFAVASGLTGASATAVMGPNTPVDGYFSVPSPSDTETNIQYRVAAGPIAVDPKPYPSAESVAGKLDKSAPGVPRSGDDPDISLAVTDEQGNASWLAANASGGLPDHSVVAIVNATKGPILEEAAEQIGVVQDPAPGLVDDESLVIVDEQGNRSEFALDRQGRISQRTLVAIALGLANQRIPGLSTLGDSITIGTGADEVTWPQIASDILGADLWNPSRGGEASADIATRSGALTPALTLEGGSIPSGVTAVAVTSITPSDGWRALTGTPTSLIGDFDGVLCGIAGKLKHSPMDGSWSFTRASSGSAVACPAGSKFYMQEGKAKRNDIWVMWPGRNNPNGSQVRRDIDTMISFLDGSARYLVLGILNNSGEPSGSGGYDTIIALNNSLASRYGESYFDMRRYLIDNGLSEAGITPTSQDMTDIANDILPSSLRADGTHPNKLCTPVIARKVANLITEKGWISR